MAVTAATPANLVVGAGEIYIDAAAGGATMDNNTYRVEQEWYVPQLNGVKGALVGTDYKTREEAFLETSMAEINATTVGLMIPGSDSALVGATTTIDTDDTRRISTADYHDYELRVPGLDGKLFKFIVDDAIQTGNAEFEAADDGTLAPRLTVRASWDPADLTASPFRITVTTASS
ncbi:MAG: hypothetical protein LC798_11095 [Chloroflexi bacterium]|nr:hypothetical protein [Chloroflexota bacterium]